jgi:hypothetical protein
MFSQKDKKVKLQTRQYLFGSSPTPNRPSVPKPNVSQFYLTTYSKSQPRSYKEPFERRQEEEES